MATEESRASSRTQRCGSSAAVPPPAVDAPAEHDDAMSSTDLSSEPSANGASSRPAPRRRPTASRGLPFVIQMHSATHLHYDFRLGWGGVLKSWVIAKGPSYNPQERRLAVQVEDHPSEYGGFEGAVLEGHVGAGTVMIWDQGSWWPQLGSENVNACLRSGHLKFELGGSKMRGKWALIRIGPDTQDPNATPHWLLIKERDKYERGPGDRPITDERPNSAVTGRSLQQIAAARDHFWPPGASCPVDSPGHTGAPADSPAGPSAPRTPGTRPVRLNDLPSEPQPDFIPPQLAMETTTIPSAGDWIHELKLDGYRIQARKSGSQVTLMTRKGADWTHRMPSIAASLAQLPTRACTLDGEVVALGENGNSSFAQLQAAFQHPEDHPLTYFVFDILHLDGHSTRNLSLRQRKELLHQLLPSNSESLRLTQEFPGQGVEAFRSACTQQAEGILSKRADAPYRGVRSSDWLESRCLHEQDLIIAGFTLSSEGPDRIGSLLLGYYPPVQRGPRKARSLIYAGRTGTGFSQGLRRELLHQFVQIRVPECPFATIPRDNPRNVYWVQPVMVAQIRFSSWTSDHLLRQAAFLGIREDRPASAITLNPATSAVEPKKATGSSMTRAPRDSASHRSSESLQHFTLPARRSTRMDAVIDPPPTPAEKILYPECGLTREQLAQYYALVAERLFPYIANRPLSLVCCPEGAGKPCFWQKHLSPLAHAGIKTIAIQNKISARSELYVTVETQEAIASLAQMDVLEIHPWGSTSNDLEHPDRLIIGLDPDPDLPWVALAAAAAEVRQRLINVGLESFLKLSGGKNLHIIAPIQPTLNWTELKTAAHTFTLSLERHNPFLYVTRLTKTSRTGKIYLDYLRSQRGATTVAPYSPLARTGAPVSLPVPWSALNRETHPVVSVQDLLVSQLHLRTNPWREFLSIEQQLHPRQIAIQ